MILSVELLSSLFSPEAIIKKAQSLQIDKSINMLYCYLNCKLRIFANHVWLSLLKVTSLDGTPDWHCLFCSLSFNP